MLAPITAATTVRTAAVEIANNDEASFLIQLGAELNTNSTNVTVELAQSDDGGAWTNFYTAVWDNTAAIARKINVGTNGKRRQVRVRIQPDSTTNGPIISSVQALLKPSIMTTPSTNEVFIL
jgi:hypothetical protein